MQQEPCWMPEAGKHQMAVPLKGGFSNGVLCTKHSGEIGCNTPKCSFLDIDSRSYNIFCQK